MDDVELNKWFSAGIGIGILLGIGAFLVGCPPSTCVEPSVQMVHHNQQQGRAWNGH
jgi:hypothetical protein